MFTPATTKKDTAAPEQDLVKKTLERSERKEIKSFCILFTKKWRKLSYMSQTGNKHILQGSQAKFFRFLAKKYM